jgi:FAD-dependent urate hydroxylase
VHRSASPHSPETPLDVLIADGRQRAALVAVRDLGRTGLVVGALESDERAPAFASRWCAVTALVPDVARDRDAYLSALLTLCKRHRPRVVIPVHDGSIEAIRARRAEIERLAGVALAPELALDATIDKQRTFAVAKEVGIRLPRGAIVNTPQEVGAALSVTGLPAVVKPTRSWVEEDGIGRRLASKLVRDLDQAARVVQEFSGAGAGAAIQEWLPGDRQALSFLYASGQFQARFAQRADRTSPPLGGNSVVRESIPLPDDITSDAEVLIQELDLEGYSEIEFRRDSRGRGVLMEINPRLSASVEIAVRAGVPFPRLLYSWARGDSLPAMDGYRTGVRMRWLGGDLSWLASAVRQSPGPDVPSPGRAIRTFFSEFAHPAAYDYLDRGDPLPALTAAGGLARRVRDRVISRRSGVAGASRARDLDTEVAIIGAGPYGLSLSAHLSAQGTRHEIFGEPMDTWRDHMPVGMYLKSEGFATNLSHPGGEHTLAEFCEESAIEYGDVGVPISLETFTRYGDWFQQRVVPRLDRRLVTMVRQLPGGFELMLEGGKTLRCRTAVVATGVQGHAYTPPGLRELPNDVAVHTYHHRDPSSVTEGGAVVIGAGQSALEAAALIHESGGDVRVVARTGQLHWNSKPETGSRSLRKRLRYPRSGLGDGRAQRIYANHPLAIHTAPREWRARKAFTVLGPAGAWWLRPRIAGQIETLLGRQVASAQTVDGMVRLQLRRDGDVEEATAGQVVVGTGYHPDVENLSFLDESLRERISRFWGSPILDRSFESSVPGLYFIGYAAAVSFGPLMRFVFGAAFTAGRVSDRMRAAR